MENDMGKSIEESQDAEQGKEPSIKTSNKQTNGNSSLNRNSTTLGHR